MAGSRGTGRKLWDALGVISNLQTGYQILAAIVTFVSGTGGALLMSDAGVLHGMETVLAAIVLSVLGGLITGGILAALALWRPGSLLKPEAAAKWNAPASSPGGKTGMRGTLLVQRIPAPGSGVPTYVQFATEGIGQREIPLQVTRRPRRLSIRLVDRQDQPIGPPVEFTEEDLPVTFPVGTLNQVGPGGQVIIRHFADEGIALVVDDEAPPGHTLRLTVLD
ncbi:MAG TPA: hypothetical protein VGW38_05765 [Chloroflexota bacterium]|nr:hypothetical protein [Chloroflexota bacterium]